MAAYLILAAAEDISPIPAAGYLLISFLAGVIVGFLFLIWFQGKVSS